MLDDRVIIAPHRLRIDWVAFRAQLETADYWNEARVAVRKQVRNKTKKQHCELLDSKSALANEIGVFPSVLGSLQEDIHRAQVSEQIKKSL